MAWWEANHYTSTCLPSEESDSEEEFEEDEAGLNMDLDYKDADLNCIKYVMGDVTHPKAEEEDAIIVHCLGGTYNNSNIGWGGQGGWIVPTSSIVSNSHPDWNNWDLSLT